jgi:hypothetical protein
MRSGTSVAPERLSMHSTTYYRVVGVRHDGSKRLLCGHIDSRERAERLAGLLQVSPFASVVVEIDDESLTETSDSPI